MNWKTWNSQGETFLIKISFFCFLCLFKVSLCFPLLLNRIFLMQKYLIIQHWRYRKLHKNEQWPNFQVTAASRTRLYHVHKMKLLWNFSKFHEGKFFKSLIFFLSGDRYNLNYTSKYDFRLKIYILTFVMSTFI